jgi:hypothetical protein
LTITQSLSGKIAKNKQCEIMKNKSKTKENNLAGCWQLAKMGLAGAHLLALTWGGDTFIIVVRPRITQV